MYSAPRLRYQPGWTHSNPAEVLSSIRHVTDMSVGPINVTSIIVARIVSSYGGPLVTCAYYCISDIVYEFHVKSGVIVAISPCAQA